MNIGLIDVDGHGYPNLALMKLSMFHKQQGHKIGWYDMFEQYDIVYMAKVFTFTSDFENIITNAKQIIKGGTGYGVYENLECDKSIPDYSIYKNASFYDPKLSYGFITRGCIRKCPWCIVPKKEGGLIPYMDIEEIAQGKKHLVLMDNNVLASAFGLEQIEKSIRLGYRLDFNQGLDARIIAKDIEIVKLLSRVKWLKPLRMAFDSLEMEPHIRKATELLREYGCTPRNYFIYVLLQNLEDSYYRINLCKELSLDAFAQPYRDFSTNQIIPQWQKDMARYVNLKTLYKSMDFKEYEARKYFKCSQYFL